jgi:hypothetical protein
MVLLAPRQRFSAVLVKVIKIYAPSSKPMRNVQKHFTTWVRCLQTGSDHAKQDRCYETALKMVHERQA